MSNVRRDENKGHLFKLYSDMVARYTFEDKNLIILKELANQVPNRVCFDCGEKGTTDINLTIGSFVCMKCSDLLQRLNPPHTIRSTSLANFNQEEIEFLLNHGNLICRKIWLGQNHSSVTENEWRKELSMSDYLVQKYERKLWHFNKGNAAGGTDTCAETDDSKIIDFKRKKINSRASSCDSVDSNSQPNEENYETPLKTEGHETTKSALSKVKSFDEHLSKNIGSGEPFDKYAPLAELDKNTLEKKTEEQKASVNPISPSNPFKYIYYQGNTSANQQLAIQNSMYRRQQSINAHNEQDFTLIPPPEQLTRRRPSGVLAATDSARFSWYDKLLNTANTSNGLYNQQNVSETQSFNPGFLPYGQNTSPQKQPFAHHPNFQFAADQTFYRSMSMQEQMYAVDGSKNPFAKDKENVVIAQANSTRRKTSQQHQHQQLQRKKSNNPFE